MQKSKTSNIGLTLFIGRSYFVNDGAQLYIILQPLDYTLKRLDDTEKVVSWKSKKRTTPVTTNNSLSPQLNGIKIQIFVQYLKKAA